MGSDLYDVSVLSYREHTRAEAIAAALKRGRPLRAARAFFAADETYVEVTLRAETIHPDAPLEGAAIAIGSWHIEESRRFLGSLSLPEEIRLALQLEEWIVARCRTQGTESLSTRCIQQFGPASLRRKSDLDPVLQRLVEHKRCWISGDGRQRLIHIHPSLLYV